MTLTNEFFGTLALMTSASASGDGGRFYEDPGATVDDIREAVTTFEEIEPTARRVLGGTHPLAMNIEAHLQNARSKLASFDALSEGVRDLSVS